MQQIDLSGALGSRASISIDPEETAEEKAERIRKDRRQHQFDLVKSYVVFFLILIGLLLVGGICAYEAVINSGATPDTKRWAQTTLSALFTGSVSFVLGQMTAKK